jgi:hypothetical protein
VQADRHGHRFLVVQQQRRQGRAHAQPVATGGARHRVHRAAEVTQPVDVPAHGAQADAEPVREFGAGPVPPGLQQRQQAEQPG